MRRRRNSRGSSRPVRVHLKVDTGMHRVGAQPGEAVALAKAIDAEPGLELRSVFTHCAVADEPDNPFTATQLERFRAVLDELEAAGLAVPCVHAANTAAALDRPDARLDLVRVRHRYLRHRSGPGAGRRSSRWRPAMSLHARVSHVKRVAAGEGISYGLRYRPDHRDIHRHRARSATPTALPRRLGPAAEAC